MKISALTDAASRCDTGTRRVTIQRTRFRAAGNLGGSYSGFVRRSFVTAPAGGGGTARKISVVPGATVLPALENAAKPPALTDAKSPPMLLPPLAEITVAVGAHGAMAGKQTVAA